MLGILAAVAGWHLIAVALVIAALVIAVVVELGSRGANLLAWAVVLIAIGALAWFLE